MQRPVRQVESGEAVVAGADGAEKVCLLVIGVEEGGCGYVGEEGGIGVYCGGGCGYEEEV